jgi:acyl dehydratase
VPIDVNAVGRVSEPYDASWDSTSCLLYALGVGAGVDEPAFTTETTDGVPQQVLPTFAVVIGASLDRMPQFGTFDFAKLVHGEQRLTLQGPIPTAGTVEVRQRIVGIYDKGKAAVVASEREAVDVADGRVRFTAYTSSYISGEGGWGGDRGPASPSNAPPERPADLAMTYQTSRDQALIYRLSGDRNALHTDPAFARRGGFDGPILHGLCTYGFAGRALLHGLCASDPARFRHIEGRFAAVVYPGDVLTTSIWVVERGIAVFNVARGDGTLVIDRGEFRFDADADG